VPASLVYAAEDQWAAALDRGGAIDFFGSRLDLPLQRRFGDLAAVQAYCAHVLALPGVRRAYPDAGTVRVRRRAGAARAHYEADTATIALPLSTGWAARESVVLHELAHHVAPPQPGAVHGVAFRAAMCRLAEEVLGASAALVLRAAYEAAGLRTTEAVT
jgi:putative metallohydrolase (TIGR04338 family)